VFRRGKLTLKGPMPVYWYYPASSETLKKMITGKNFVSLLKASLPREIKTKEFHAKQANIWAKAIEKGLDKEYGFDLLHLVEHHKIKSQSQ